MDSVRRVVDLYVKTRNMLKAKKAEAALLAPLDLDTVSFIQRHKELEPQIRVASLTGTSPVLGAGMWQATP